MDWVKYFDSLDNLDKIRLFAPLVSGYAFSALCPMTRESVEKSAELPQRPPAYAFGIVWPILYVLLGVSWVHARGDIDTDIAHGLLTVLLCLWIIAFSCFNEKKYGMYILSFIVALTVCCMCLQKHRYKLLLTPLLAWTSLALHLNYHSV